MSLSEQLKKELQAENFQECQLLIREAMNTARLAEISGIVKARVTEDLISNSQAQELYDMIARRRMALAASQETPFIAKSAQIEVSVNGVPLLKELEGMVLLSKLTISTCGLVLTLILVREAVSFIEMVLGIWR